jgi:succinyl-CoA synthetase alpha subunit
VSVTPLERLPADQGFLFHIIKERRPELAERIKESKRIESIIIGLGRQGTRHAGLMMDYGTDIVAGIAPGRGGTRVHEIVPVYDTVTECLADNPDVAVASIWRHYSTAKDATLEVIKAGVPVVVLISEGIPLRDVRDILVTAREHNTLLLGGNTPGIIFPPEGIKAGMLPDVFHPAEPSPGKAGAHGVTIISRSGAILYHMSDALASAGIAQNAVLGVGGDGAIGAPFPTMVPLAQSYPNTDLVVVAGEIGGCQEELLAEDITKHPERYPKPIVALISGANAPEGKTMGHAGAIVSPGTAYGTFASKKGALEAAGVTVVNSQHDLIEAVKEQLGGKSYFDVDHYYERMRNTWENPPSKAAWGTLITKVEPNNLVIAGYPLQELIGRIGIVEMASLLVRQRFPTDEERTFLEQVFREAAASPGPEVKRSKDEDISKTLAKCLLLDDGLAALPEKGAAAQVEKTVFALGRMSRYLAVILETGDALDGATPKASPRELIWRAVSGRKDVEPALAELVEAMVVACVDHGVTPPSAQATLIAASTRAAYEVSVAHGVGAITDVHGGAGAKAAAFFRSSVELAAEEGIDLPEALRRRTKEAINAGRRIEGMGHRVHTKDPRRDALWTMSGDAGVAGDHVAASKLITEVLSQVRGLNLPINVDGVIGAVIADMGLDPALAKAVFIYGRVAGLSAHYFEEVLSQNKMRRINFSDAVYKGPAERHLEE